MTNLDIDTRTDVYSLGVLLYELLVGAQPFDSKELRKAGLSELQRRLREQVPPKPSTRVSGLGALASTSADNRGMEAKTLSKLLSGDLDRITMKSMEKDRVRRYETPSSLATSRVSSTTSPFEPGRPASSTERASSFVATDWASW